jgi:hypothetical protein
MTPVHEVVLETAGNTGVLVIFFLNESRWANTILRTCKHSQSTIRYLVTSTIAN